MLIYGNFPCMGLPPTSTKTPPSWRYLKPSKPVNPLSQQGWSRCTKAFKTFLTVWLVENYFVILEEGCWNRCFRVKGIIIKIMIRFLLVFRAFTFSLSVSIYIRLDLINKENYIFDLKESKWYWFIGINCTSFIIIITLFYIAVTEEILIRYGLNKFCVKMQNFKM